MLKILLCPFAGLNLKSKGPEKAPLKVKESLNDFFVSEEGRRLEFKFKSLDLGEDLSSNYDKIENNAQEFQAAVGGDHSLTFPLFKSLKEEDEELGLVLLDAHPDCQSDFYPPTYEDVVRVLIKQGVLSKERLILVGLRNWSRSEYEFLKQEDISYFPMKEIAEKGFDEILDSIMYRAKNWNVYLSIDIDVLDPAFAPGTTWREPGGISARKLISFVQRMKNLDLKFLDLMEINPDLDVRYQTVRLGAKILTCLKD